jgi:hypothetical protein
MKKNPPSAKRREEQLCVRGLEKLSAGMDLHNKGPDLIRWKLLGFSVRIGCSGFSSGSDVWFFLGVGSSFRNWI